MPKLKRKTKLVLLLFLIVVVISGVSHLSPTSAQDLLFVGDFETGDLNSSGFFKEGNSPTVESAANGHPVRAGNYSTYWPYFYFPPSALLYQPLLAPYRLVLGLASPSLPNKGRH